MVPGPRTHYLEWSPTRSGILTSLVSTSSAADAQAGAIYSWSVRSNDEAHELRQTLAASPPDAATGPPLPSPSPSPLSRAHESDSGPVQAAQRVDVGDDISCFHLHPSSPGGLLAVSLEETLKEYTLHQGGALAFLPDGSLMCAFDADLWHLASDHLDAEGDICDVMRDRAARGYVLDAGVNADICGRMGQSDLYRAWAMVSRLLTFDTLTFDASAADRNVQADRPEPARWADKDKHRCQEGGEGKDDARPRWGVWGVHTITETFKDVESWHIAKPLLRTGGDSFIQRHASLAVVPPSPLRRDVTSGSLDSLRSDDSSSRTPTALSRSRLSSEGNSNGNNSSLRAAGQGNMMVDVYISEARRRILHICEYDFGEAERYDDDGDFEGSEALEKRVTRLDRKHDHAHAAFTRLLQVDLSSALECLYKGAGYEQDGGAAGGGGDGASCAMAAIAMAGAVHAEADSAVWRRSYMHLVKSCTVRACRHGAMLSCLSLPPCAASTGGVESRCRCATIWACACACCLLVPLP